MSSTILIIDDSAELCALMETILPYSGYRTLSAGTAAAGLALIAETQPDLVIVDFELPDGKGLDVLEALNRQQPVTPSILMTGYGSEGVAAKALRLGALGYLIKPFTVEEVLSSIERALSIGRMQRERATLSSRLEMYDHHFRAISALTRAMIVGLDASSLIERIVEAGLFTTRAERCFLAVVNAGGDSPEEDSDVRVVAFAGRPARQCEQLRPSASDERLMRVLKPGKAVRLQSERGTSLRLQTGDDAHAVVQVPLHDGNRVIGLLSVDRQSSELPFTRHDQEMVQILADHAVLVLGRQPRATEEEPGASELPNAPAAGSGFGQVMGLLER
ncbi:MAG TPA: response regulator [Anaerolineae bacterium]|nr:response regulator [Anaerolineae bacterium]